MVKRLVEAQETRVRAPSGPLRAHSARTGRPVRWTGAGTTNPGRVWVRLPHGVLNQNVAKSGYRTWSGARGDQSGLRPIGARGLNPAVLTDKRFRDVG
jgi:hypothetical protein